MRLKSCYVCGFGQLKDYSYTFKDGLNEFYLGNGLGKTTFADFIKAMLYGMPSAKRTEQVGERERYLPFEGGRYGGTLTLQAGGKEWKIERFFDASSAKKDTLAVYVNGNAVETGDGVGEQILGLDEASFVKTVYINSSEPEIKSTSGINARLGSYADGQGDVSYEQALKTLEDAKKVYKAERGRSGRISRQEDLIAAAETEANSLRTLGDALEEKYALLTELTKRKSEADRAVKQAAAAALLDNKWQHYEQFVTMAKDAEDRLNVVLSKYPHGLPTLDEVTAAETACANKIKYETALSAGEMSKDATLRKKHLDEVFEGKADDVTMAAAEEVYIALGNAKRNAETARINLENCHSKLAKSPFYDNPDVTKDVQRMSNFVQNAPQCSKKQAGRKGILWAAFALLFIAAIGGGVAALFFVKWLGIAMIAVGAAGLFGTGFLYLKKLIAAGLQSNAFYDENTVAEVAAKYGYPQVNLQAFPVTFISDYQAYCRECEFAVTLKNKCAEKDEQERLLAEKYNALIAPFGVKDCDFYAIKESYLVWKTLSAEQAQKQSEQNLLMGKIAEADGQMRKFAENYFKGRYLTTDEIKRDISCATDLQNRISEHLAMAEKCKPNQPRPAKTDATACSDSAEALAREIMEVQSEIADIEAETEGLPAVLSALDEAKETLDEMTKKYKVLSLAADCLKNAETNLRNRYVLPVRNKFIKYCDMIKGMTGDAFVMDKDFNLRYEKAGALRPDAHLSLGERTVCSLCFRLAVCEEMFGNEPPFAVLDDPFVSLDESHLKSVLPIVAKLGEKVQILYFCCHESRKIGVKGED